MRVATLRDAFVHADSKNGRKSAKKKKCRTKRVLPMGAVERREPSFCLREKGKDKNTRRYRRACSTSFVTSVSIPPSFEIRKKKKRERGRGKWEERKGEEIN